MQQSLLLQLSSHNVQFGFVGQWRIWPAPRVSLLEPHAVFLFLWFILCYVMLFYVIICVFQFLVFKSSNYKREQRCFVTNCSYPSHVIKHWSASVLHDGVTEPSMLSTTPKLGQSKIEIINVNASIIARCIKKIKN